jgi:tetratricopeptide (TPR) repeat protein/transcriptional regulator with XRE-family HTH domain
VSLSELLRGFRARAGLTQAALAEKAGLSEQAISVLERGTRSRPRMDTIRSLTAALGLNTDEAQQFLAVARGKSRAARPAGAEPTTAADAFPMPWQLPPAAPDFTGRGAQIDAMLSVLRNPLGTGTTAVGLVAVTGMGGIGKTTLAVQAAHLLIDSYPDGHLYLNLRGYGPGKPMTVADAQRQLLRSLGLDLQLIPDDVEEAAALLRSQLAGRRVLMLLDNAADVPHVLPLLPGSPGSAAIITSRGSLANLPGARQIRLDALSEAESIELLTGVIGQARVAAEPNAVEILAMFSGRLPLAVRLIGGRLATRPAWPIQHLVAQLQDEERRLDSLGSDETGVRASIASSVRFLESSDRDLDRQAARALPLLSIPDGSDLLTVVAAGLLDLPMRRADAVLERLVDLNLLESVAPERYRFHDLIRAYARELADQTLTPTERDQGLTRVLRLYIAIAWACQARTHLTSPRLPFATVEDTRVPAFRNREEALRWLDDEQRNLMDRVRQAAQSSLAGSALFPELALALFGYHESRRRWVEMRELGHGMVELAQRLRLRSVAAWLQHDSAIPEAENGDVAAAADRLLAALPMFRDVGDLLGQARCCSSLAYVFGLLGRVDEALGFGKEALDLSQQVGDKNLEGVAYTAVGGLYDRAGDFGRADEAFAQGIALAEQDGDLRSVFKRYVNAAFSHLQVGRYVETVPAVVRSLTVAQEAGDRTAQAESHHLLALAYAAQGQYETARGHIGAGMQLAKRNRDPIREGRLQLELARINAAVGDHTEATVNLTAAITNLRVASPVHEAFAQDLLAQLQRDDPYTYTFTSHSL